jgi:hypothetical protein
VQVVSEASAGFSSPSAADRVVLQALAVAIHVRPAVMRLVGLPLLRPCQVTLMPEWQVASIRRGIAADVENTLSL